MAKVGFTAKAHTEPPLDDLYNEAFAATRRRRAVPVILDAVESSKSIANGGSRSLWLAQLCCWLPEIRRGVAGSSAIAALAETDEKIRADVTARVLQMLSGVLPRQHLEASANEVENSLTSKRDRSRLQLAKAEVFDLSLPPIDQLLNDLADDELRLLAMTVLSGELSPKSIRLGLRRGLTAFEDPDHCAVGCIALLRRVPGRAAGRVLTAADTELVLEIASAASNPHTAQDLFSWLSMASDEATQDRVLGYRLRYNRRLSDPAQRATGMFAAIGLGIPDGMNDQFAREGLAAVDLTEDEAIRTELIGMYVESIPGAPPWHLDHVLEIALGVADQRLRARALTFAMMLDAIGRRALQAGMELDEPWARAAVIFGWANWRDPPSGFTRRRWARTQLEAARAVPAPAVRARYLALAAAAGRGRRRAEAAADAWSATLAVTSPQQQTQLLYALAVEGLADRRAAVDSALEAARRINDSYRRYEALARVGRLLSAAQFAGVLRELLGDIVANAERLDFVRLCEPPGINVGIWWE